jgi:hypothetical protein
MQDGGTLRTSAHGPHKIPMFETLNSYSHMRGTVNIGNPAIIWHRAYWRPPNLPDEDWHRLVNEYIAQTFGRLHEQGRSNLTASSGGRVDIRATRSGRTGPIGTDLSAFYVSFESASANITIVFEKFDEFWSIKTIVDFSKVTDESALSLGCFQDIYRALVACEQVIVDGFNAAGIEPPPPHDPGVRHQMDETVKQASLRISAALYTLTEELFPHPDAHEDLGKVIAMQDLFAHFIGFSLGLDNQKARAERLDAAPEKRIVSRVSPKRFFSRNAEKLGNLVDAIWPVAKWLNPIVSFNDHGAFSSPDPTLDDDQLKREFTISRLNRGRAIYMTSLGGIQSPPQRNIYFPLSYLLVSPHKASWQIGRMVDRLHTLGMFRLAILRDYDLIEQSNTKMGGLIDSLNKKSASVESVSDEFDQICPKIENGLHYRIEWSRYYIRTPPGSGTVPCRPCRIRGRACPARRGRR